MQGETDDKLRAWLQKEQENYVSGYVQNDLLCFMAHSVLHKITKPFHRNTHYALMADEVMDWLNCEQFVVSLQGFDDKTFVVCVDSIALYQVDDITATTHSFHH